MEQRQLTVAVAANFTPDLVRGAIAFWLGEFAVDHRVAIAPYNQLLQELLDPASLFGQNRGGFNVALVRLGDWARKEAEGHGRRGAEAELRDELQRNLGDLAGYAASYSRREGAAPLLVCICPEPPETLADTARAALFAEAEQQLLAGLAPLAGVRALGSGEILGTYPVAHYDDPQSDELGHIPYTPVFFSALGTLVARAIRAYLQPPFKVLALDCDNTIWTGVVGEDGAAGVEIDEGRKTIQRLAVAQGEAGMLVCLASKNVDEDVDEVFKTREMPLRRSHIVASKVNWNPKSENLRELGRELNLGLDSFVFADDSRVECAEVRASCPDVLTIELPAASGEAAEVLRHVWAFDRWKVTAEDRKRGELYKQNIERDRTLREAPSMGEFLAGLNLKIDVSPPTPAQLPRVAQLTFRTNQFNASTVRRAEAELSGLLAEGKLEALAVTVSDRFGDYGLVGVVLFDVVDGAVRGDTFLLSCRVLQRGVEHRMVARLGEIAVERGLARVDIPCVPTAKNQPARDFLRGIAGEHLAPGEDGGFTVRLPAAVAAALVYEPGSKTAAVVEDDAPKAKPKAEGMTLERRNALLEKIAREYRTAEQIHARIESERARRARPEGAPPPAPARGEVERELVALCEEALGVAPIGVSDDLFLDFGADSLAGVRLAKDIRARLGKSVDVVTVLEARTVEKLAAALQGGPRAANGGSNTLYTFRDKGDKRPLFLVRPASSNGGSLSYVSLARHVDRRRPLYTFLNRPLLDGSAPYPSLEAMADEYLAAMKAVQPEGPYLLAGWCLGGKVAFEMASRLADRGERTAALVLFDTLPPATRAEQLKHTVKRLWMKGSLRVLSRRPGVGQSFPLRNIYDAAPWLRVARDATAVGRFQSLAYWAHEDEDAALVQYAFPKLFDSRKLRSLSSEAMWDHVFASLKARWPDTFADEEPTAAQMRKGYRALAWDHRLDTAYSPRRSYPGEVHLFTVRGGRAHTDGWQRLCRRPVTVHEIDVQGTKKIKDPHNAMMQEENVRLFAAAFNRALDEAE